MGKKVTVNLIDHCASDEINQGVTDGKRFSESFGGSGRRPRRSSKDLSNKSVLCTARKIIKHLLGKDIPKEKIITLSLEELNALDLSTEGQELRGKYIEKKRLLNQSTYAFPKPEGEALTTNEFEDYLRNLKRTRLSMEFNGHYCRGLLEARYKLPSNEDSLVKINYKY
ncbi:hypothetical protein ACI2OX_18200 [Bacillus sp. N9]